MTRFLLTVATALSLVPVSFSAQAQVIVGDSQPAVTVNQNVLDRLGPGDNVSRRFLPESTQPVQRSAIRLTPPSRTATAEKPRAKVAAKKPEKKKEAVVAKAEPVKVDLDAFKAAPSPATPPAPTKTPEQPVAEPKPAKVPEIPPTPQLAAKPAEPAPAPVVVAPVVAAPTPAPVAPPAPAPQQTAMVAPPPPAVVTPAPAEPATPVVAPPPAAATKSMGSGLSIGFSDAESRLPESAKSELAALADRMAKDAELQVRLQSYASGEDASRARRMSLSRALAVRAHLIDLGVRSVRIDVQALGNRAPESGASDRVDVLVLKN